MSRRVYQEQKNADAIYDIHGEIMPHCEYHYQEAKCKLCGLVDEDGDCEDEEDWATIIGWSVCKECYSRIPRFARMMAEGYYMSRNKFAYSDPTSDADEKEAEDRNAEAMRGYQSAFVIGYSQPMWDRPLSATWIEGYKEHLRRIQYALETMIETVGERLSDEGRRILTGIRPLDDDWVLEEDEEEAEGAVTEVRRSSSGLIVMPWRPAGSLIVMPREEEDEEVPAQKTDDELVFEMMEIIDKLKETDRMNDNDYLILCNNLKNIRERLMRPRN